MNSGGFSGGVVPEKKGGRCRWKMRDSKPLEPMKARRIGGVHNPKVSGDPPPFWPTVYRGRTCDGVKKKPDRN